MVLFPRKCENRGIKFARFNLIQPVAEVLAYLHVPVAEVLAYLHVPVAEVLAYLHVQVAEVLAYLHVPVAEVHVLGKNTDTAIVGYQWTGVGGHHALYC